MGKLIITIIYLALTRCPVKVNRQQYLRQQEQLRRQQEYQHQQEYLRQQQ